MSPERHRDRKINMNVLKDITGSSGSHLSGRRIVLCVTGSVAAVESPGIARALMRHGADVIPVMSQAATRIIHPDVMEWATGNPPVLALTGRTEHIQLAGNWKNRADLVLVAPATANTISKIACGIDDTPVTTVVSTAIGSGIPILIAPGMHESLLRHPAVSGNIERLKSMGLVFVESRMAESKAKIASIDDILDMVIFTLSGEKLLGKKVIVTAGPTVEYIDPVRTLSNRSSGRMGIALALEARRLGASVTLIYGPGSAPVPPGINLVRVVTSDEMLEAVKAALADETGADFFVAAAAVADFRPAQFKERKIPTSSKTALTVEFLPTPKLVDEVKRLSPGTYLAAFKAEHGGTEEEIRKSSLDLLKRSGADLVVANDVSRPGVGFGEKTNEVTLFTPDGKAVAIPSASKDEIAGAIWHFILGR